MVRLPMQQKQPGAIRCTKTCGEVGSEKLPDGNPSRIAAIFASAAAQPEKPHLLAQSQLLFVHNQRR